MNILTKGFVAASILFGATAVNAAEVQISTEKAGKGTLLVAMDLVNAKGAAGFNFRLSFPGIVEKGSALMSCAKLLPSNWNGSCSAHSHGVYLYATSEDMAPIQNEIQNIGTFTISIDEKTFGGIAKMRSQVVVDQLSMVDSKGVEMPITAVVDEKIAGEFKPRQQMK